ncbi:hypothetical protein ETE50_01145 [Escherichia coli]|nr:hypothetical protein ETE50_01145 [Escherichia coli]
MTVSIVSPSAAAVKPRRHPRFRREDIPAPEIDPVLKAFGRHIARSFHRGMTKAQWAALPRDCKAVRSVAEAEDHGAYRYRRTMDNNFRLVNVYITDMKITEIPQK